MCGACSVACSNGSLLWHLRAFAEVSRSKSGWRSARSSPAAVSEIRGRGIGVRQANAHSFACLQLLDLPCSCGATQLVFCELHQFLPKCSGGEVPLGARAVEDGDFLVRQHVEGIVTKIAEEIDGEKAASAWNSSGLPQSLLFTTF